MKEYLEDENSFTEKSLLDTKSLRKKLFREIKGRIKLDDESLPFKDKQYEYWTRVTKEGNYSKKLRRKIGANKIEIYWDGDLEAKGKKFFNTGDISVSNCIYNSKKLSVKCERKFEINSKDVIVGFSSKNCF